MGWQEWWGPVVSQLIDQASVDRRDDGTVLHLAAYYGHTHVVTRLLDAGWSLEARDGGYTPLSWAAWGGHLETVQCLLLRGADIDTQDNDKWTPLHRASRWWGHTEVIKTLLHHGAKQEIKNKNGDTAENLAKNIGTRKVFKEFNDKKRGLL